MDEKTLGGSREKPAALYIHIALLINQFIYIIFKELHHSYCTMFANKIIVFL